MNFCFKSDWIYHYGAPLLFSADKQFFNKELNRHLRIHHIEPKFRPFRPSQKNGKVERWNFHCYFGTPRDEENNSEYKNFHKTSIIYNQLHPWKRKFVQFSTGQRIVSLYLKKIPFQRVPEYLLRACGKTSAARATSKLFCAYKHQGIRNDVFPARTDVCIFSWSSMQNEKWDWVQSTVISATTHFTTCKQTVKNLPKRKSFWSFSQSTQKRPCIWPSILYNNKLSRYQTLNNTVTQSIHGSKADITNGQYAFTRTKTLISTKYFKIWIAHTDWRLCQKKCTWHFTSNLQQLVVQNCNALHQNYIFFNDSNDTWSDQFITSGEQLVLFQL